MAATVTPLPKPDDRERRLLEQLMAKAQQRLDDLTPNDQRTSKEK